jgi:quercetin dioxygenase-like cupin family protein
VMAFYYYSEAKESEPVPGVKRRMAACGDRVQIIEYLLPKGTVFPLNRLSSEQISYIVRGRLRVTIKEEESILSSGDGYLVPSDVEHGAVALEDSVVIDVFSPPIEEQKED